ncbi:MAG: hypothetical protein AB7V13_14345 [Pseudorhodoplanes sp.]|uniref:hypothetical protein n=1 Tax=Pseudorhodoplanes sp. TaxID=1934341 RepID=UPI003D0D358A
MTDRIIDGSATGRQQLLHMLRDVCKSAAPVCEAAPSPALWKDRAEAAIKACTKLQRGLFTSHPQLADELNFLAAEIQIALAAQSDEPLFAARIQRIRAAIHRLQQVGAGL